MSAVTSLTSRIDAEFADVQKKIETFQKEAEQEYEARETRYREQFVPAVERLSAVWQPRLQVLGEKFRDRVQVKPVIAQHTRQAKFSFDSKLARIELTFSVGHDADVRNLVFDQNLEVVPILMKFDKHSSLTVPLDDINEDRIAQWIDDRIVAFVQTFLAIHQNQYYQKDTLVTDPVSGTQMPRYAAKCTLDSGGKTYYFVSETTRREFQDRQAAKG